MGIAEATFYVWKKKYGQLGVAELRMLEEENPRLKHPVADSDAGPRKKVKSRPAVASLLAGCASGSRSEGSAPLRMRIRDRPGAMNTSLDARGVRAAWRVD